MPQSMKPCPNCGHYQCVCPPPDPVPPPPPTIPPVAPVEHSSFALVTVLGAVLAIAGVIAVTYAFYFDTTVVSRGDSRERIHNVGLQAMQQLIMLCGLFSALTGVVVVAADSIYRLLLRIKARLDQIGP